MERLHKGRFRNRRTVRDLARARLRSINLLLMHLQDNVEKHTGDFNGQAWKWYLSLLSYTIDQKSITQPHLTERIAGK